MDCLKMYIDIHFTSIFHIGADLEELIKKKVTVCSNIQSVYFFVLLKRQTREIGK
jgi:hypothetical protein